MQQQRREVENLLSYTEASSLTGLSFWKLKYAVQKGRIDSVRVATRVALVRDSVLEFAGKK